jgi:hypothetical protein
MDEQQYLDLVDRLFKTTQDKKISWKKTLEDNVFMVDLKGFSVALREDYDEGDVIGYSLTILDAFGDAIEQITSHELDKWNMEKALGFPYAREHEYRKILKTLCSDSRREARVVEKEVGAILTQLNDLDDEIPF